MSARGVFAVDREIWDDADFADEPFSEREAFLWLVGEAAWKAKRVRVGSAAVDLQRGQCAFSTRFMASKWKWSEARVRRFLARMKKSSIIDAHADAHATHITICKYDKFQRVGIPSDAPVDAVSTQERRKEETGKQGNIEDNGPKPDKPVRTRNAYPDDFEVFWAGYPTDKLMSKAETGKAWAKLSAEDRSAAVASLPEFKAYCRKSPDYRPVHAERYLKWRRFDGFQPSATKNCASTDPRIEFGGGVSATVSMVRQRLEKNQWYPDWHGKPGESNCVIPRELWADLLPKKPRMEHPTLEVFH